MCARAHLPRFAGEGKAILFRQAVRMNGMMMEIEYNRNASVGINIVVQLLCGEKVWPVVVLDSESSFDCVRQTRKVFAECLCCFLFVAIGTAKAGDGAKAGTRTGARAQDSRHKWRGGRASLFFVCVHARKTHMHTALYTHR